MRFIQDDGGRAKAGFKGETGDCVTRAIAIATGWPYLEVYNALNQVAGKAVARTGVRKSVYKNYIEVGMGWKWIPTMLVGQGCKVHLRAEELPKGRLIVRCSKHLVAVIDGVIHDTYDCSRDGTRCVYGYWKEP